MTFGLASNETALGEKPAHSRLICPRLSPPDLHGPPASIDAEAFRDVAARYAEPASTFGLELKVAHAIEARGLSTGGDRIRRPFFRLAQEPIIWSWWDALQRVPLDPAEMVALARMLAGKEVRYRECEMFAHGGGSEAPIYYEPADGARGWIADIAAVDGGKGDPVRQALYRFARIVCAHPFSDGNGRFARAALQGGLGRAGVIPAPCLALAPVCHLNSGAIRAALGGLGRSARWEAYFDAMGAMLGEALEWVRRAG
jgi:Fic/DOC family